MGMMPKIMDLTGHRYNMLTVMQYAGRKNNRTYWQCICDCGNIKDMWAGGLIAGKSKSCGCVRNLKSKERWETHGKSKTRIYKIWKGMKTRCYNKNYPAYPYYGGKGITICNRWNDFELFYVDMGDPPTKKHEIDRIDNTGNYDLTNCRWATPAENSQNQSTSKRWVINGIEYLSTGEASKKLGLSVGTVKNWCDGFKYKDGRFRQPKQGCYSYKVYPSC